MMAIHSLIMQGQILLTLTKMTALVVWFEKGRTGLVSRSDETYLLYYCFFYFSIFSHSGIFLKKFSHYSQPAKLHLLSPVNILYLKHTKQNSKT